MEKAVGEILLVFQLCFDGFDITRKVIYEVSKFLSFADFVIYENIVISKLYILVSLSFQSH